MRSASPASVKVNNRICANVTIGIGDRECYFEKELKGPVKIELQKVNGVTEFVSVNQLTASVTRLNSAPVDLSLVTDPHEGYEPLPAPPVPSTIGRRSDSGRFPLPHSGP